MYRLFVSFPNLYKSHQTPFHFCQTGEGSSSCWGGFGSLDLSWMLRISLKLKGLEKDLWVWELEPNLEECKECFDAGWEGVNLCQSLALRSWSFRGVQVHFQIAHTASIRNETVSVCLGETTAD